MIEKRKALLLGESSVGKTSLVQRFVLSTFNKNILSTAGLIVTKPKEPLHYEVPGKGPLDVILTISDIQGNRVGKNPPPYDAYMRGADAIMAVFDVTRPETVEALAKYWVPKVRQVVTEKKVPVFYVGNKSDLKPGAYFGQFLEIIFESLKDEKIEGIITSALSGNGVEDAFRRVGRMALGEKYATMDS